MKPAASFIQPTTPDGLLWCIIALLSACRWYAASAQQLKAALARRGLIYQPRLSYWMQLCHGTGLLSNDGKQPTLAVPDFLSLSRSEQVAGLLAGWASGAEYPPLASRREALIRRLYHWGEDGLDPSLAPVWNSAFERELDGLRALGLWDVDRLTPFGVDFFTGRLGEGRIPAASWRVDGSTLKVPFPPDWRLVWDLEAFLDPAPRTSSGEIPYPLTQSALRRASARGKTEELLRVLERGLGAPLPTDLRQRLLNQATIRIHSGTVIEFDDPNELVQLRKMRPILKAPMRLLSPRHLLVGPEELVEILRRLGRAGLLEHISAPVDAPSPATAPAPPLPSTAGLSLNTAERAYLLSLIKMNASGQTPPLDPPLGLERKLAVSLPGYLRGVIERKTARAVERPHLKPIPQDEPLPDAPSAHLLSMLHNALRLQEPLTIIYKKPGGQPESRRVTPLVIEQRGQRWYLVAFCHRRRANRVFRLDRLELPIPPVETVDFDPSI